MNFSCPKDDLIQARCALGFILHKVNNLDSSLTSVLHTNTLACQVFAQPHTSNCTFAHLHRRARPPHIVGSLCGKGLAEAQQFIWEVCFSYCAAKDCCVFQL